jgi:hypothetical protein
MKRIILALSFLAAFSGPAWADYNLGTLSPTATQTVILGPGSLLTSTTFQDTFNFTIGGAVDSDLTVEFQGNPNAGVTFELMNFTLYASDSSFITDWNGFDSAINRTITFSGLDAFSPGDYYLVTDGQFSGHSEFSAGDYTMTFTTAVPEPEVYAMLSVGLGLMGWIGRRRKLKAA